MKSMTGFAKRQCTIGGHQYNIEIRTLNSKGLDIITKLPNSLWAHDLDIRSLLGRMERGKIDLLVTDNASAESTSKLNMPLALRRYSELEQLASQLHLDTEKLFRNLIAMPELWNSNEQSELTEEDWALLAATLNEAIDEVERFRQEEGAVLRVDFVKHVDLIEKQLNEIPPYESERIATAKERIHKYFSEAAVKESDPNRFEQELIYYLEKLDITEEKVRLQKHIDYFRQTMETEASCGKKLSFVAQEMGREINTIGSKANHVEIQKLVVNMKDELEKIKEQLGNIL